jgi:hypothetical protein
MCRAIEEGRRIFANIRRFIVHLMAGNVAEGIILVLGICVGLDPPLNPLQILWINLVTGTARHCSVMLRVIMRSYHTDWCICRHATCDGAERAAHLEGPHEQEDATCR